MATNENFMVPYQPAVKSQGFQTQKAPDITAQLRQNQQVAQQNFANIQNAFKEQQALDRLDALAPFSQNLSAVLVSYGERRAEREKKEGVAQFFEDKAAHEQALAAHQQQIAPIQELDGETSAAAADAVRQGVPFSVADKLKEYSGWARYGYAEAAAISMGNGYKSWSLNQRQNNQGTITLYPGTSQAKTVKINDQSLNPAEDAAVRAHLREQYLAGSGLANLSKGLQVKAFQPMEQADVEMTSLAEKNYAIRKSDERRDIAIRNFQLEGHSDFGNIGKLMTEFAGTVDRNGNPLGNRGAQKLFNQVILDQVASGVPVDFKQLEAQIVPWDSKGRTFGELYGKPGQWLGNLQNDIVKAKIQYDNQIDAQMNVQARQFERAAVEDLRNRPGGFTKADIDVLQDRYRELSGGRNSSQLESLAANDSQDAEYIEEQEKLADRYATTGLLTPEFVNSLPNSIRNKYAQILKGQQELLETPEVKRQTEAIAGLVKGKNTNAFIAKNMGVDLLIEGSLQQQYKELIKMGMDPLAAFKQVKEIYQSGTVDPNSVYYISGGDYPNFLKQAGTSQTSFLDKKQRIKDLAGDNFEQAIKNPEFKMLSDEEHKRMEATYGTTGFQFPPIVQYYAQKNNIPAATLVNQLRANRGMDPLTVQQPRFTANAVFNDRLLNRNPTPLRATRALAKNWSDPKTVRNSMKPTFVGSTGLSTGPHLDYRVWDLAAGRYVDPGPFMDLLSVNGKPIGGNYRMSSPYGLRTHPVTGEYRMHHGIDFAMEAGTRVDVQGKWLEEIDDPTAGIMQIYAIERDGRKYELRTLHGQRR